MSDRVSGHGPEDNTTVSFSTKLLDSPSVKSFLGGVISSTSSCILLQPLDLVKTRIQSARTAAHRHRGPTTPRPKGLLATTVDVAKNERVFGLWQGLSPSLLRTVPGVGLYFLSLHTIQTTLGWTELSASQGLLVGALARCIVGTALLPVTVVKTRFESKQYFYRGIASALRNIHKHEGYKGLYSGLSATLLRDAPFSGLYLAFYTQAKLLVHSASSQVTIPLHFACGVAAGILASSVTQPFDLVKTNMQLNPYKYPTFRSTFKAIIKNQGVTGLFAGMVPRCIRRTLMAAVTWTVYEEMKVRLNLK
ncbi:mitochondrial glycine transporter B [Strongylocentrotus purpuratus]|uniref:Mitochondrial glycine transporter n=1 Tax=Strongylocentrotus purpuratus TaxID=7668 RepID=A0A7M7NQY1_STRPU|nr:mitochondrial glycine transporter B [Strongylocentrotus purpuratus]XP_030840379.1 mitochondrial glycine transporter B [Strongylocentrotus purpuratus]|eukprot:XP_781170.3 PREDICTED: solute carrier family 25 member 38-B [Strongylocentrotus purpuratus]